MPDDQEHRALLALSGIEELSNTKPALAKQLARLKISRLIDLALHFPYRYLDYTQIVPINRLQPKRASVFEGTVVESQMRPTRKFRSLVAALEDDFGRITIRFFRVYPWLHKKLVVGNKVRCYGTPYRFRTMEVSHPRVEEVNKNMAPLPQFLTPVYRSTAGLTQKTLIDLIDRVLDLLHDDASLDYLKKISGAPRWLMELPEALAGIHRVKKWQIGQQILMKEHATVKTVIFHDILANLLALEKTRKRISMRPSPRIGYDKGALSELSKGWSFRLTDAQKRAIHTIASDLQKPHAMLRLLQGDVGSGKTVVAAFVSYLCRLSQQQVALLAPTEILCEQHLETIGDWFQEKLRVEILTSSIRGKNRRDILSRIANQEVDLVIGTHALFQGDVQFKHLGLVIIDEQQRFGVEHRVQLTRTAQSQAENKVPHQLMMTATPIPRTLATASLSILDCTILDQMPEGRSQIRTSILPDNRRDELIERVRQYVDEDKQVFWVSPRIDEDEENLELQSVKAIEKTLGKEIGSDKVGVVHGRLKPNERERIIGAFRNREFPILVATTVVEVGVDIPNATLMVIEHCERLGLSQIHQLRGRVGRGHKVSDCVLLYREPLSDISEKRLHAAYNTNGFELARKDLELRGAGEFFGTEQSGTLNMRVGNLFRDEDLLAEAHRLAKDILNKKPETADAISEIWIGGSNRNLESTI